MYMIINRRNKLEERVRMNKLKAKKKEKTIGAFDLCKYYDLKIYTEFLNVN